MEQAIARTLEHAERFKRKLASSVEGMEESSKRRFVDAKAAFLLKVRKLLQEDSDSEGSEDEPDVGLPAATSQNLPGDAAKPAVNQATAFRDEKGFDDFAQTKDGSNLVHLCCTESRTRSP